MTETRSRRLFFGLRPDAAVRRRIVEATAQRIPRGARPVARENLHVTLAFLGSLDDETAHCVEAAGDRVEATSFRITLEQLGHWRRPQILWLGPVDVPEALHELERKLEDELADCGFRADGKSFRPHVTLARRVTGRRLPVRLEPIAWMVDGFCLFESLTLPGGVQYRVVREWALAPPPG